MKRFLVLIVVVLVGCEEPKPLSTGEIIKQVNASGKITDAQAESLSKAQYLYLSGLTSINDAQAESLSRVNDLCLNGLTSITDQQAESLSKVSGLFLNGLNSITEEQAESLSKVSELYISEALQPLIDKYKNQ